MRRNSAKHVHVLHYSYIHTLLLSRREKSVKYNRIPCNWERWFQKFHSLSSIWCHCCAICLYKDLYMCIGFQTTCQTFSHDKRTDSRFLCNLGCHTKKFLSKKTVLLDNYFWKAISLFHQEYIEKNTPLELWEIPFKKTLKCAFDKSRKGKTTNSLPPEKQKSSKFRSRNGLSKSPSLNSLLKF